MSSCHMYRVAVSPRIKRSSLAKINLHQMPGSHSVTADEGNHRSFRLPQR